MVKILVNGIEVETERYKSDNDIPIKKNIQNYQDEILKLADKIRETNKRMMDVIKDIKISG